MKKENKTLGRPQISDADRKQSFTVSITMKKRKAIVAKFGSLTAALESITI